MSKGLKNKKVNGVTTMPDGREVCDLKTIKGNREYKRRTGEMASRQYNACALCHLPMALPTFDHEAGRGMGGSGTDDRIVDAAGNWKNAAVHFDCNGWKGSKRYIWLKGRYLPIAEALERTA